MVNEANNILDELKKSYEKNKQDYLTPCFEDGHSIFNEIPDFPIVYSKYKNSFINFTDFEAICNQYNIRKKDRDIIIETLFGCKNSAPKVISRIKDITKKPINDDSDDSDDDTLPINLPNNNKNELSDTESDELSDSEKKSDSESEDESDDNYDINTISTNINSSELKINLKKKTSVNKALNYFC